ncbi:hypothetical protein [Aurantivibrio infirmus]
MKNLLIKITSPILNYFESGQDSYSYKESHRTILKAVGALFLMISTISLIVTVNTGQYGGVVPILVFLAVGVVCEIVGFLGSDKAVANIWKSR